MICSCSNIVAVYKYVSCNYVELRERIKTQPFSSKANSSMKDSRCRWHKWTTDIGHVDLTRFWGNPRDAGMDVKYCQEFSSIAASPELDDFPKELLGLKSHLNLTIGFP